MASRRYTTSRLIELSRRSKSGRIAIRYKEVGWFWLALTTYVCLMLFDWSLGIHIVTDRPQFGYRSIVYSDIRIVFISLVVLATTAYSWKLLIPLMRGDRIVSAYRDGSFVFYGEEVSQGDVAFFERRTRGILSDFAMVLKDGREIVGSESLVRGFPV